MLKLRHSPTSPYVRKVMVALYELDLAGRVEMVPAAPWSAESDVAADNPLGKIPALNGTEIGALYDSPVILDYLDQMAGGGKIIPATGPARWTVLRRQALADGVLDAAVACVLERRREAAQQSSGWLVRQMEAVNRALDVLEAEVRSFGDGFDAGLLSAAIALGYLDFRLPDFDWRANRSRLSSWEAIVCQRPSMQMTMPHE